MAEEYLRNYNSIKTMKKNPPTWFARYISKMLHQRPHYLLEAAWLSYKLGVKHTVKAMKELKRKKK